MTHSALRTAAFAATLLTGSLAAQSTLQILHASDLEGGVDAIADAPNFAAVVEGLELDAVTRGIDSILLSSGDNYIPGPFFSAAGDRSLRDIFRAVLGQPDAREGEGRIDISVMNILGFDAAAVGNHEFDNGTATFESIIATDIRNGTEARWLGAQFPYLSANLDFSADSELSGLFTPLLLQSVEFQSPLADLVAAAAAPKLAPSALVTRGGVTYGVVGATTPLVQTISSTGGVTVRGPGAGTNDMVALAQVLQPTVDALLAVSVDKIILVSHLQQFALEQALAEQLAGVDIILAGGSDTLLADGTDRLRAGDVADGSYPFLTTDLNGDPVVIASTDGQYSYVGRLVVDFDAAGKVITSSIDASVSGAFATDDQGVIDVRGSLATAFAAGTKAAQVRNLTDAVTGIIIARDANVVGRADVFLEGRRTGVRTEETNMGNLTADANLFVAQSFDSTVLVSHKNGGGIRNPIGSIDGTTGEAGPNIANPLSGKLAGEVSQLDIENTLRFNNALTLLTLTRAQLKEVIEHAVSQTAPGSTPGRFGQWGGISFSFDPAQPVGSRVRYASLTDPSAADPILVVDGMVQAGAPVRIVTLNFLADGGDSYPFPAFVAANAGFANRVDLPGAGLPAGASTFAAAGTEQDALAEYMLAMFSVVPFGVDEEELADDQRVQQIGTRPGLTTATTTPMTLDLTVSGATPSALAAITIAFRSEPSLLDFGALGLEPVGLPTTVFAILGSTDGSGGLTVSLPNPPLGTPVPAAVQFLVVDDVMTTLETSTTEVVGVLIGA